MDSLIKAEAEMESAAISGLDGQPVIPHYPAVTR